MANRADTVDRPDNEGGALDADRADAADIARKGHTGHTVHEGHTGHAADRDPDTGQAATDTSVNGVVIERAAIVAEAALHGGVPDPQAAARQALVVRELLTQRAVEVGLLGAGAPLEDDTVESLLALECATPAPSEDECRRYYAANAHRFSSPDMVFARHILFALTGGTAMSLLRARAEAVHRELAEDPDRFDELARRLSNCSSGQLGGNLGQLVRGETVPEFEAAVFAGSHLGLLPELVKTRYGFHIVLVERRIAGRALAFETVRETIARFLSGHVRHKSIHQYVAVLAANAVVRGIELDVRAGPLMQ